MHAPASPRICIVGGGFSGAVTAVQLARKLTGPAIIDIIEPRPMLGGGVAYSATDPSHRINVPAAKMVVFGEDPLHFDRWLQASGALALDPAALRPDGAPFPQRQLFGRYLAALVEEARHARPGIEIYHRLTRATAIEAEGAGFLVDLADGQTLRAGAVVLAVSHPAPAVPPALREPLAQGAPIIADPWTPGAMDDIPAAGSVLVVGTGLTMADAIATLERRCHRGPILAISRRGLLSRGHPPGQPDGWSHFATAPPPATALALSRETRHQVRVASARHLPWQVVFDDIRANAPRLWGTLPLAEKRRLIRHLRPFWDVHRFRVSPQAEAAVASLRLRGQLTIATASLAGAAWNGTTLSVRLKPRGGTEATHAVQAVINTTGPAHGAIIDTNPALASLAAQGLLRMDPTGLGLDVDARDRAIGAGGQVSENLFIAGPLARGRVGELMGLPQVSQHAEAVAGALAAFVSAGGHLDGLAAGGGS